MILVTGAGGKTGKVLIKALSEVESVHALVYRSELAPVVTDLGAEQITVGDMRNKSVVQSAMQGARAVYHIPPNMDPDEMEIGRSVLEAAREADVQHFVYHSVLHPQTEKMSHHWAKLRVEELTFESGLPFTVLQPAPYMQNLLAGWKSVIEDGLLRVPYSVQSEFSFIDLEDLAEAARIVLTEPGHVNAIYELAGTKPTSHVEVAEVFGQVLDQTVRAQKEVISNWKSRAGGMSKYAGNNLVKMFEYYDRWGLKGNPNVLRWLLKREPTSLEAFAQRTAKEREAVY